MSRWTCRWIRLKNRADGSRVRGCLQEEAPASQMFDKLMPPTHRCGHRLPVSSVRWPQDSTIQNLESKQKNAFSRPFSPYPVSRSQTQRAEGPHRRTNAAVALCIWRRHKDTSRGCSEKRSWVLQRFQQSLKQSSRAFFYGKRGLRTSFLSPKVLARSG